MYKQNNRNLVTSLEHAICITLTIVKTNNAIAQYSPPERNKKMIRGTKKIKGDSLNL